MYLLVPYGTNVMHVRTLIVLLGGPVSKEERRTIPLLLSDNDIIWIIGLRIDERFKITKNTSKALKVTATPSNRNS